MLSYIKVSISNNPYDGSIDIDVEPMLDTVENTFSITVSRRIVDEGSWEDVYTKEILTIEEATFKLKDVLAVCGTNYHYNVEIYEGNSFVESQMYENVRCQFDGLFIGDFNKSYVAGSNFKTDYKVNRIVEYVTTLASKYPFAVSNASVNYITGTSTGLFLPTTPDKRKFERDYYSKYTDEVMSFLSDGGEKILKTHDGHIWYVLIDANPQQVNSGFWGANDIQFSWTEIGEVPVSGMIEVGE